MDKRLTELETRYTYLERVVDDLSKVLHEQQRTIETLSTRLRQLETIVAEAIHQSDDGLPQEKPPHY